MKRKTLITSIVICLAVILFVCLPYVVKFLYFDGMFMPPPSKAQIERNFTRDRNLLVRVANYMENAEEGGIYINDSNLVRGEVSIDDTKTTVAIHILLMRRYYSSISRYENAIIFQKSINFFGAERGIAYSMDGNEPIGGESGIMFLIRLEPLSEPNWYYYEADYNEWRVQNR